MTMPWPGGGTVLDVTHTVGASNQNVQDYYKEGMELEREPERESYEKKERKCRSMVINHLNKRSVAETTEKNMKRNRNRNKNDDNFRLFRPGWGEREREGILLEPQQNKPREREKE